MLFGLIINHNISTAICIFFSLLYLLLNIRKLSETNVKKGLILNIIFILTLSFFYICPLMETKSSADYQVYKSGMMSTPEDTQNQGLRIKQLFVTANDGSYVFELGPHIIIMLAFSVMAYRRIKPEVKEQYRFLLIIGLLTLFMATKYFPWKFLLEQASYIQFPWRILMMSAFSLSIICAINMSEVIKKFNYKDVIILSLISVLYILAFSDSLMKYTEQIENIEDLSLGYVSGKEYETVAGMGKGEYLPCNAYNNRFYIATRDNATYVLDGKALIENEVKNGTHYTADIETFDAEYTVFELPYIYYPGYELRLDGMVTDTFETTNGFLGFIMYKNDKAKVEVNYEGTTLMKISSIISFISLIVFSIYVWKKH